MIALMKQGTVGRNKKEVKTLLSVEAILQQGCQPEV